MSVKPMTFSLKEDICKLLKEYSEETGVPLSRVVSKALKEYIENNKK